MPSIPCWTGFCYVLSCTESYTALRCWSAACVRYLALAQQFFMMTVQTSVGAPKWQGYTTCIQLLAKIFTCLLSCFGVTHSRCSTNRAAATEPFSVVGGSSLTAQSERCRCQAQLAEAGKEAGGCPAASSPRSSAAAGKQGHGPGPQHIQTHGQGKWLTWYSQELCLAAIKYDFSSHMIFK